LPSARQLAYFSEEPDNRQSFLIPLTLSAVKSCIIQEVALRELVFWLTSITGLAMRWTVVVTGFACFSALRRVQQKCLCRKKTSYNLTICRSTWKAITTPEIIPAIPHTAILATWTTRIACNALSLQEALARALEDGSPSSRGGPLGQYGRQHGGIPTNPGQTSSLALSGSPLSTGCAIGALSGPGRGEHGSQPRTLRRHLSQLIDREWHGQYHQGLNSFSNGQTWDYASSIIKPLPTGGLIHASWDNQYQYLPIHEHGHQSLYTRS